MTRWTTIRAHGLLAAALATTACNHLPGPVEDHWGESVSETRSAMVANPEAGNTPAAPIDGIDPISGEITVKNYETDSERVRKTSDEEIFLIRQP